MKNLSALLFIGWCFTTSSSLHGQNYFLEISPRVMYTTLYAEGSQGSSGLMPLLSVYIYPGEHFGIGFFGTSVQDYTTTGLEFIATTDRSKRLTFYGLNSVYFLESNLPGKQGTSMSTIGLGLGVGTGVSLTLHRRFAINLIELNYQNNVLAGGYLFSSDSNPARHAITFESGLIFRLMESD